MQISAYVDVWLASLVPIVGAVAALSYAQTLYTLPVSLFGMSVSAAELPQMSGALGTETEVAAAEDRLLERMVAGEEFDRQVKSAEHEVPGVERETQAARAA